MIVLINFPNNPRANLFDYQSATQIDAMLHGKKKFSLLQLNVK